MRLICTLVLLSVLSLRAVSADWRVASSEKEFSPDELAEHWTTKVENIEANLRATLHLVAFDSSVATLRVIDQTGPLREDLAAAIDHTNAVAGVNGGYFDAADAPIGLLVSDGRLLSPLRKAKLLTGVLFTRAGRMDIVRANHFSLKERPEAAVQCGPLL